MKKILIVRNDRIGDMIVTLPAIAAIKRAFPTAEITVLASETNNGILELLPFKVKHIIDKGFIENIKILKRKNFDLGIDFVINWRGTNSIVLFLAGIKKRIGFLSLLQKFFYNTGIEASSMIPVLKQNLSLLWSIDINAREEKINLKIPEINEYADLVIHPGSYYPSQRWPIEYYISLIKQLKRKFNYKVAIIGSMAENELIEEFKKELPEELYVIEWPYVKTASLMKKAKLFIGNNSGPLHLASAVDIVTISFTGPTNPKTYNPIGEKDIVLQKDIDCIGCHKPYCEGHECMRNILPEEVVTIVEGVVSS